MRKLIVHNIVSLDGYITPDATEDQKEISRRDNAIQKVVVSDTLKEDETAPWSDTTRIVRRKDAHEQIAELKRGGGGDIIMFGSRTLWNDLLYAGLVDELHLMIGPVVLGGGTPAFAEGEIPPLKLIGTQTAEGSDNLLIRYAATPR
jgi:dihydrofolate reductase